jgi:hypothetical protein
MPMTFREITPLVMADFRAGNAVVVRSDPGAGKTDWTHTLLAKLKLLNPGKRVGMCRVFMATASDISAIGMPWKGTREFEGVTHTVTDNAMPEWYMSTEGLPACCYDIVLMVLEEWGQGLAETKKAFAPLLLEGGIGGFRLPVGSPRLALTNLDTRDGVTKEFDFVIGRRGEYDLRIDTDVWVEDFAEKPYEYEGKTYLTMPITVTWVRNNPGVILEGKPAKQGPWCNPRTVAASDRFAQCVREDNNGELPLDNTRFIEALAGKMGMGAATSFIDTARFEIELPSCDEVIKDPQGTAVPGSADRLMLMAYKLAGHVTPADCGPVLQYVSKMPKDMMITFVTALLKRDAVSFAALPPMQAVINKNAALISMIAGL